MTVEAGIVGAIDNLTGLRTSEGWPDAVNPDVAIVDGPTSIEEGDIHGCHSMQTYEITLLFSMGAGMARARGRLMEYLAPSGSKSIRAALYADPTLGGQVQAFNWRGLTQPPGRIQIAGKGLQAEVAVDEYYGAVLQIECVSAGG